MNTNKLKTDVARAFRSLKKSDCLVMNKKLRMTDTLYRKSDPSAALFESDISCDFDVCLWTLAAIGVIAVAGAIVSCAVCKTAHGMKWLCHSHKSR